MLHRLSQLFAIRILSLCCIVMLHHASLCAQSCQLFTIADALPNTLINDIIEDADNYIWVATDYGLCKYDGAKFTTYLPEEGNPHSLQQPYVRSLFIDKSGHLLVGTRAGLQVYRPQTDDFSLLARFADNPEHSLGDVTRIIERKNGEIWMSGNISSCVRIEKDGTPVLYPNKFTDKVNYTETLVEDNAGRIWVNRRMKSLYRLEVSGEITTFEQDGERLPFNCMFTASDGVLYAGGQWTGLYRYDMATNRFEKLQTPGHEGYLVTDMHNYDDQNMVVATDNQGLKIYNYRTGEMQPYLFDDGRTDPLTQKVHAVVIDHNNDLWLGLYQKGVMMVRQQTLPFKYFGSLSSSYNCVGDKCVTSMSQSRNGYVWVSTDNGGLYAVDYEGRQVKHFPYTGQPHTIPASLVRVFEDGRGRVWYGAFAQGYGWVDTYTGRCTPLKVDRQLENSSNVFDFAEDNLGRIWVATMGTGVYMFDERSQSLDRHVASDSCRWASCAYFDQMRHHLYVGSFNGLTEIDTDTDSLNLRQYLSNYIIYHIAPYTSGRLVLCTSEGLILFNMNDGKYVVYTADDGLPSNMIYAAESDGNGLLWLTTNAGLSCFNEKRNSFINYTEKDGLQSNEFYKHASMRDANGDLWFGGTNGISYFNPSGVSSDGEQCDVRIVGFMASGRKMVPVSGMELEDNSFSFEMATVPLGRTHHGIYSYSLDSDPWTSLRHGQNIVTFSHLSPGRHVFRYRVAIGESYSDIHQFEFRVAYPWYKSWWSYLLIAVLVCCVIYLGLLQLINHSTIRKRLAEHIQSEEVNEAKLQFFMEVAHKIRTPMTLIMSPLQELIDTDSNPERQNTYRMLQHNTNRLVELINQLMDQHHIDGEKIEPLQEDELLDMDELHHETCASQTSKLVVVADADDEIRQFISQELTSTYRVIESRNGREAIDMIVRLVPDLIISDVNLPELSGMDLCRRVRQNVRVNHIPVVMLSDVSTEDTRIECLDLGADAFVAKPFNMKVLMRTAQNLMQGRDRLRNSYSGQQLPADQVDTPESKSPDERLMERILKVVNQNLSNPDLTSEMIASEVGMSRVHLYRKLKELTNQSARNFIRNIRLAKAAELLAQKKVSVAEVADKVGFGNTSNFATSFKELYGVTPTAYMEEHIKQNGDNE
ncbi:MAG: helix-turn-helix domain-containing protein [Bacteroidales bacterium]|nr:helix-turn-helix domain-containing protein [Candidatus Liminaster caballi]